MQLMKAGIFCTEPYRVPKAGKVNACFFDKTGTITTDRLEPVGLVGGQSGSGSMEPDLRKTSLQACYIMAGCHSLLDVGDDKLLGDPMETARYVSSLS